MAKKIIDGKKYNTETAKQIAKWKSHHLCTDFNYYEETLYQTKKGAFFLYGSGNAYSPYSEPVGNNGMGGSEAIKVMNENEVKEWLEEKGMTDIFETLFEVVEG